MKNLLENTVIVPWDFSEMSKKALQSTIEMVEKPEQIEVIHVTPYPSAVEPGVVWGAITEETIVDNLKKSFSDLCQEVGLPPLKFTAVFGDPGIEVCSLAKSSGAGLIVISSHGRTGLRRMLLGSVAERVVRLAPCPVLVLRDEIDSE